MTVSFERLWLWILFCLPRGFEVYKSLSSRIQRVRRLISEYCVGGISDGESRTPLPSPVVSRAGVTLNCPSQAQGLFALFALFASSNNLQQMLQTLFRRHYSLTTISTGVRDWLNIRTAGASTIYLQLARHQDDKSEAFIRC